MATTSSVICFREGYYVVMLKGSVVWTFMFGFVFFVNPDMRRCVLECDSGCIHVNWDMGYGAVCA